MENKCEGNENKIILGVFNVTMEKLDSDGGNETRISGLKKRLRNIYEKKVQTKN